ncbi:MAG: HAD family phosphatase [bacterium]|nr:HAD family phosphatase [bacterium]
MKKEIENYKALLYDFDGILVDTEGFYFQACRDTMREEFGFTVEEDDYYLHWTMKGEGLRGEMKRRSIQLDDADMKRIDTKRLETYGEYCRQGKIAFIPGMLDTIQYFNSLGLKTAIASNTAAGLIGTIFEKAGITPPCPIIGRQPGLRGKPKADIFIYAAGYLQVDPVDCCVVEDAVKGIVAAQTVGMGTVLVKNRYLPETGDFNSPRYIFENHDRFMETFR